MVILFAVIAAVVVFVNAAVTVGREAHRRDELAVPRDAREARARIKVEESDPAARARRRAEQNARRQSGARRRRAEERGGEEEGAGLFTVGDGRATFGALAGGSGFQSRPPGTRARARRSAYRSNEHAAA